MNFASYDFWKLLILCFLASQLLLAAARAIVPSGYPTVAKMCLLGTGLVLLAAESWLTLAAFFWVVSLGWLSVLVIDTRWDRLWKLSLLVPLLLGQLAPLFYYKYWNFVLNEVLGWDVRIPSVLIPMGLSFYTFQTLGFWIDQRRDPKPRPSLLDFFLFSSFFPQIVAGPIEKREALLPQIERTRFRLHRENSEVALQWIVLGLAYKLIVADNLGNFSEGFQIAADNAWHVWFECLVFGLRIYFDFAGYSFIAVGLGLLFGVHLTLNFRCPYCARSPREFWRDWHVTLGAWLRDYVYIPLGGRRVRWWALNIVAVFVVSGIWHGAGWGFLIWGLLHGIGVAVCSFRWKLSFPPLQWVLTFLYTIAAWLFFFERDSVAMAEKAFSLIDPSAYSFSALKVLPTAAGNQSDLVTTSFILALGLIALGLEAVGVRLGKPPYHVLRKRFASLVLVFLTVLLAPTQESSFIYFNF